MDLKGLRIYTEIVFSCRTFIVGLMWGLGCLFGQVVPSLGS